MDWLRISNSLPLFPIIYEGPAARGMYALMADGRCFVTALGCPLMIVVPQNGSLIIEHWDPEKE